MAICWWARIFQGVRPLAYLEGFVMQINNFVHVLHPELGSKCLPPGEVPEWAEPLITNPKLIVAGSVAVQPKEPLTIIDAGNSGDGEGDDAALTAAESEGLPPAGDESGQSDEVESGEVPIPPKGGRGGSAAKWAEYAASKGFEIDDDATASDIREALEAEGIPTE